MTDAQGSSPAGPELGTTPEAPQGKRQVVVVLLRNSPVLSIAALLHLLIFAIFSVVYIVHDRPKEKAKDIAVNIAKTPLVLPPEIEAPPEIIDRNSVPILPTEKEGPVNPDPV